MPLLEAPAEDSSSETSLSPDLQRQAPPLVALGIQIRLPTPEEDVSFQAPGIRAPTLHMQRIGDRHDVHMEDPPPFVHLLPVTLPPQVSEPTLDELLRRVTERNDLQNVEAVRLRVISYTISLSRLALFLPRLQHLDLNGSVLNSLRDLGFGLVHLTYLNVSNCGLNSFDGIGSGTPAIRTLIADNNMIQRVGPLADLTLLQHLSMQNNCVSDLSLLTFLGMCPNLTELKLRGNPVCHLTLYRVTLQRSVCTLQSLDEIFIAEETETIIHPNTTLSTDDELSSLSSEIYPEMIPPDPGTCEEEQEFLLPQHRPATAPNQDFSRERINVRISRPLSASDITLSQNNWQPMPPTIVAGSVVNLALRRRNRLHRNIAWISSSSSSSQSAQSAK